MAFQSTGDFLSEARALVQGETNLVANLANISSHIFYSLGEMNWCGFYLLDEKRNELVLGPFQGRVACLRIPKGRGVCGSAWSSGQVQNIADVTQIENHIVCDSASRSELVFPLIVNGNFHGVLDLDSPRVGRFDAQTEQVLTQLVREVLLPLFL